MVDCSYSHGNKTSMGFLKEMGETRFLACGMDEECCGTFHSRYCCLRDDDSDTVQSGPAIVLSAGLAILFVIGVIGIVCWRLACVSAYNEASASSTRTQRPGNSNGRCNRHRTHNNLEENPQRARRLVLQVDIRNCRINQAVQLSHHPTQNPHGRSGLSPFLTDSTFSDFCTPPPYADNDFLKSHQPPAYTPLPYDGQAASGQDVSRTDILEQNKADTLDVVRTDMHQSVGHDEELDRDVPPAYTPHDEQIASCMDVRINMCGPSGADTLQAESTDIQQSSTQNEELPPAYTPPDEQTTRVDFRINMHADNRTDSYQADLWTGIQENTNIMSITNHSSNNRAHE